MTEENDLKFPVIEGGAFGRMLSEDELLRVHRYLAQKHSIRVGDFVQPDPKFRPTMVPGCTAWYEAGGKHNVVLDEHGGVKGWRNVAHVPWYKWAWWYTTDFFRPFWHRWLLWRGRNRRTR